MSRISPLCSKPSDGSKGYEQMHPHISNIIYSSSQRGKSNLCLNYCVLLLIRLTSEDLLQSLFQLQSKFHGIYQFSVLLSLLFPIHGCLSINIYVNLFCLWRQECICIIPNNSADFAMFQSNFCCNRNSSSVQGSVNYQQTVVHKSNFLPSFV